MRTLTMTFINVHGETFTCTDKELREQHSPMTVLEYIMYCFNHGYILVDMKFE